MWYRNPGKWIRELLPNQTKTPATTLIWSLIFILDIVLVFFVATHMGMILLAMPYKKMAFWVLLLCLAAFGLLLAEARIWDAICHKNK